MTTEQLVEALFYVCDKYKFITNGYIKFDLNQGQLATFPIPMAQLLEILTVYRERQVNLKGIHIHEHIITK